MQELATDISTIGDGGTLTNGLTVAAPEVISGISEYNYEASFTTVFTYSSATTEQNEVAVNIDLDFKEDYLEWGESNELTPSVPPYSLLELGSPLQVLSSTSDDLAPMSFIDVVVKDEKPQWQTGQVSLQAPGGSSVVLRPSPDDKEKVLIELRNL